MADALIVRRGGGSGSVMEPAYAILAVEYPSGSACTCAKGGTTLRAKGTGGAAAFNIPEAGAWVASCTDGSRSAQQTANVTKSGEVIRVGLAYETELWPSEGSSGWAVDMHGLTGEPSWFAKFEDNLIKFGVFYHSTTGGAADSEAYRTSAQSLAGHGSLRITVSELSVTGSDSGLFCIISTGANRAGTSKVNQKLSLGQNLVDLSAVNDGAGYYITLFAYAEEQDGRVDASVSEITLL